MAIDYLKIISEFFPTSIVKLAVQDSSTYSNIIWDSTPIPQATLDNYANRLTRDVGSQYVTRLGDGAVTFAVMNTTTSTILAGSPVYSTGTDVLTGRPNIAPADGSIYSTLPIIGITVHDISANSAGLVS